MFPKYITILLTFTAITVIRGETIVKNPEDDVFAQLTIFNGNPAAVGEIPYFVSIKEPIQKFTDDRLLWKNMCGGSIISNTKVVTAAHCFEINNFEYMKHPENLRVVAGSVRNTIVHSGAEVTEIDNQWRRIVTTVLHEQFTFPHFDIAVVYVKDWMFTDYISYVVTATVTMDYSTKCQVAGFGLIGQGSSETPSPVLLVTKIHVMPRWKCSLLWDRSMDDYVCSDSTETDVTRGDSGGPLVCKDTGDRAEELTRDLLVGVVSGKTHGKSTLFTRVSEYNDWLEVNIATRTRSDVLFYLIMAIYIIYNI